MKTLSLDLRERILASYDNLEGTRQEIVDRYRVSLGMVKKLLQRDIVKSCVSERGASEFKVTI